MPVRKTESRIPANFQPSDLGQAVPSADGRAVLISYIPDYFIVNRENTYVVFVNEVGLAASIASYVWQFNLNGVSTTQTSTVGEMSYIPNAMGILQVTVTFGEISIQIQQLIVEPTAALESLIADESQSSAPVAGNPDVVRELVNDYSPYYQAVTLRTPEAGDSFLNFVYGMVFIGALRHTTLNRQRRLEQLADAINRNTQDFARLGSPGAGICLLRPQILAMNLPRTAGGNDFLLPWTELPENPNERLTLSDSIDTALNALDIDTKTDLFNLIRFPKSNIMLSAKIAENLRNRYFSTASFVDVLTGFDGVRAAAIQKHFSEGPTLR